jgi:hypothetical protein
MKEFIVSGGDFLRSSGFLSRIQLDEFSGEMRIASEEWISHPVESMAVLGKGFTGMCLQEKSAMVSFSNIILQIDLESYEILDQWADSEFNDIHQLHLRDELLYIANTGNESIDVLNIYDHSMKRIDFLGSNLREKRPKSNQDEDTKPHLHHISGVTINSEGELLVGLVRQSRILNLENWNWIGPRFTGPVHDVSTDDVGTIWCTTVPGEVHRFSTDGEHRVWKLSEYQELVGWTRGLAITNDGILVGTTAIRESNSDYFSTFTEQRVGKIPACLTWIPFDDTRSPSTLNLTNPFSRKIFSIEQIPNQR